MRGSLLPDLSTEYRQICSLVLRYDDEIEMIRFSGILRAYATTDFSETRAQCYYITNDQRIIERLENLQTCKARILELAVPPDLGIVGSGNYFDKTIKDLPSWLYADLVGISIG